MCLDTGTSSDVDSPGEHGQSCVCRTASSQCSTIGWRWMVQLEEVRRLCRSQFARGDHVKFGARHSGRVVDALNVLQTSLPIEMKICELGYRAKNFAETGVK